MRTKQRTVWIIAAPGTGLLNLCGVWEVLSHANDVSAHGAYEFGVYGPSGPQITTGHGLRVGDIQRLPSRFKHPPDTVIVAGGSAFKPASDEDLLIAKWLSKHAERFRRIVSICAGAFTLGEAGLLDGRKATTHWMALDRLRVRFPKANVVDEGIFVSDGPIWTSAGITAGIDLCLALVESDHGHRLAMDVAQRLVLFLRRSGNQAQFSAALARQTNQASDGRLARLSALVVEDINGDLRVPRLAGDLGMSPRTLTRWCKTELGESPAELVRRLRLEEAGRLLSGTHEPLKVIAVRSGLGDSSTLWRHFVREYGVTPEEYRARFSSVLDRAG